MACPDCLDRDEKIQELEARISSQRCELRAMNREWNKLKDGDTSGLEASLKAEKAAHKHTSRCCKSYYDERNDLLNKLRALELELQEYKEACARLAQKSGAV